MNFLALSLLAAEFWADPLTWLGEPFKYQFIQRAFVCALFIGALCGLVGVYVVLRRMSYIGHGLSHSIFGGAVVSYVIQLNFYIGASAWGFLSALLIIWTGRRRKIGSDAAIGIITTASFAIGIIIISASRNFRTNLDAALFGNILGIQDLDMWVIIGTGVMICSLIFVFYKQLLFTTFDPDVAAVYGVRVGLVDALFSFLLASLLIASMQVVGVTMIAASLVTPPIVARLLTDSFHRLMFISVAVGAFGGVVGVYASWYLNWATGATIVVTHAALFALVLVYTQALRPLWARYRLAATESGLHSLLAETQALTAAQSAADSGPPAHDHPHDHQHKHRHQEEHHKDELFH